MDLFELGFLDALQALRFPAADFFFKYLTRLGDSGIFFILVTAALLCFRRTRLFGLACAAALLLDLVSVNLLIKPLVARMRPFDLNPDVVLLVARPSDFSFPSGHTACSFAFASALPPSLKKWRAAAFVLAALIALSRLYLYLHYPSDVLAGALIGFLCGLAARLILRTLLPASAERLK